jgi:hypothetical protein
MTSTPLLNWPFDELHRIISGQGLMGIAKQLDVTGL